MKHKRELFLIAGLVLMALIWSVGQKILHSEPPTFAQVSVNGTVTASLDLKQDTEITVTEKGGGYNKLIVRNGEVWCDSASCPDKVCVQQGKKSHNGDTIACLPNKMIVTIVAQ